jgi:hypothetical protein
MTRPALLIGSATLLLGCADGPGSPVDAGALAPSPTTHAARASASALVRRLLPGEDPGPPFYARVGMQVLESDGYVAIPFYRPPALVPADFNLLAFYHFPGPAGPGAFAAPLLMSGFLLIEADAPLGTFPKQVELRGENVPVWFVPSAAFHVAAQDGVLTMDELQALEPLYGTATRYHETLHPREGQHKIVIQAHGTLPDGRSFALQVSQVHDALPNVRITFR